MYTADSVVVSVILLGGGGGPVMINHSGIINVKNESLLNNDHFFKRLISYVLLTHIFATYL